MTANLTARERRMVGARFLRVAWRSASCHSTVPRRKICLNYRLNERVLRGTPGTRRRAVVRESDIGDLRTLEPSCPRRVVSGLTAVRGNPEIGRCTHRQCLVAESARNTWL